jgi:membrane protease YdiL (CAAX protease family)
MTTVPSPPVSAPQGLLARHPLISYFIITFAFSWLMFLPGVLTYYGVLSVAPSLIGVLGIVGLLGPVLSGFVMTALTEGVAGVGDLLRRIVLWRVGIQWYLFALLGLPVVMVLGTLLRPGALASFDISAQPISLSYLVAFVSMVAIGGPLLEEPGWTGFAQPRMQRLHGPLVGGLILGTVAPARILNPLPEAHRHPPEGHRAGLRRVRPRAYWPAPGHHLGRQQHEGQRADGYPDPRFVEHILQRCRDRAVPGS